MPTFESRICTECSASFAPSGPRSKKCGACSIKKCKYCGKAVPASRTGVTCSGICAAALRAESTVILKMCAYEGCGKEFKPSNPGSKWCAPTHSNVCENCSKSFDAVSKNSPVNLCSSCHRDAGNARRNAARVAALLEKHGVENPMHITGVSDRVRETNLKKYGVDNQFKRPEILEQLKKKNLQDHGVEFSSQREDVKAKIRQTNITRLGVPVPAQAESVMERIKATNRERYGVDNVYASQAVKDKKVESYRARYGVDHPMKDPKHKKLLEEVFVERYGVTSPLMLPNAVPGRISTINKEWKKLLDKITGLDWRLEEPISGVGNIDLYVEHRGKLLALEPHPTPTHNSYKNLVACNRRGCIAFPCEHSKKKTYHQERSRALHEKGIQLISVFDWMPKDRVVAFILGALGMHDYRIAARKCELRKITQTEANRFLKQFHMLGGSTKQEHCYGLFFEGELIQVQTFAKRSGDWEARRLATRDGYQVMGGVSRGTKAFIREVEPETIVAFSDLSLSWPAFDANFNSFGEREIQAPVLCWSKKERMILDKSAAFQSADRLIGIASDSKSSPYPESMSNREVFLAEGWLPVWDCGKLKEVWRA